MDRFVDFVVREIYASAGRDPTQAAPTPELASLLCGPNSIHRASSGHRFPSCASDAGDGQLIIHVPASPAAWQVNHRVAQQLVKWYLTRHAYDGAQVEAVVRRIAAAVCVPTPAFQRAREEFGESIPALSEYFRVSQSLMALRLAECTGCPTALRTATQILVRGNYWTWPETEPDWALLFRDARAIGLTVQHLDDVPGRVVLRARAQRAR
jgi:hypothetical protein